MADDRYISGDDYVNIRKRVHAELVQLLARDMQADEDKASSIADCYAAYIMSAIVDVVDVRHSDGSYWSQGEYHQSCGE